MELLAEGRMAQVFALDEDRVLKLDRPEWSGVSEFERQVINQVADAGVPVARAHGLMTVAGRKGIVLDRVHGDSLEVVLGRSSVGRIDHLAVLFDRLHHAINTTTLEGLPDLVSRLRDEIVRSGLASDRVTELMELLAQLDTGGERNLCHFDFHPSNVLVDRDSGRWVVIDWLTAGSGPELADVARTLVLRGQVVEPALRRFMQKVRTHVLFQHRADDETLDAWVRVVASARLAEGFDGPYAAWLRAVVDGTIILSPV